MTLRLYMSLGLLPSIRFLSIIFRPTKDDRWRNPHHKFPNPKNSKSMDWILRESRLQSVLEDWRPRGGEVALGESETGSSIIFELKSDRLALAARRRPGPSISRDRLTHRMTFNKEKERNRLKENNFLDEIACPPGDAVEIRSALSDVYQLFLELLVGTKKQRWQLLL